MANPKTYYIDPTQGSDLHDGLDPTRPRQTHAALTLVGGDTVLFQRGGVIRRPLLCQCGLPDAPITYGAYGVGDKPAFYGSVPIANPADWIEQSPGLWRYTQPLADEVCNLVFNGGESCGDLRWDVADLREAGQWHYTGIGQCLDREGNRPVPAAESHSLYLSCPDNPGRFYRQIECVFFGQRKLVSGQRHIVLENLRFQYGGVHGYQDAGVGDITIRHCDFAFIGGAVWHRQQRIRFGNAIEFWDGAEDIRVEGCTFNNIYDSGITHQGGETLHIPRRLYFRDNLFVGCGMAAYECREPSEEVYFEYNTCIDSGGGFSPQGQPPPRQSEIYPQPMGHHIFIWRIDPGTQPGTVYIRHNLFAAAPFGAMIYSIIDPADEAHFIIDHNAYRRGGGELFMRVGGKNYSPAEFALYQREQQKDQHSLLTDLAFLDAPRGNFSLPKTSSCQAMGVRAAAQSSR